MPAQCAHGTADKIDVYQGALCISEALGKLKGDVLLMYHALDDEASTNHAVCKCTKTEKYTD
jgi:hypothetical protein